MGWVIESDGNLTFSSPPSLYLFPSFLSFIFALSRFKRNYVCRKLRNYSSRSFYSKSKPTLTSGKYPSLVCLQAGVRALARFPQKKKRSGTQFEPGYIKNNNNDESSLN